MTTPPAGIISTAQDLLAVTLAASSTWQTWMQAVGADPAARAADARRKIFSEAIPRPETGGQHDALTLEALRPYALIGTERFRLAADAFDDGYGFGTGEGTLGVLFVDNVPAVRADDDAEVFQRFYNNVGLVIEDLAGLAGDAGYLGIVGMAMPEPAWRIHDDKVEGMLDHVGALITVEWA